MKNTPNTLGGFDRTRLPEPLDYYAAQGLQFRERKVASGDFPAPVKDGKRCTRWVSAKVQNWLRAKGAQ